MAAKSNLQKFFEKIPKDVGVRVSRKEWQKAMEDSKRVYVITSDSILDTLLENLLKIIFSRWNKEVEKLFKPDIGGPLASLTHKARLAYSLGLIDKTALDDLRQTHNIRNIFAHGIEASFADAEVCKACTKLSTANGRKVTAKNSYKFYQDATNKCLRYISEGTRQEVIRKAMRQEISKKPKKKGSQQAAK